MSTIFSHLVLAIDLRWNRAGNPMATGAQSMAPRIDKNRFSLFFSVIAQTHVRKHTDSLMKF